MLFRELCRTLIVAALGFCLMPVWPASVVLLPSQDNTLYEDPAGSLSNGAGPGIFSGNDGSPSKKRAVIRFELAGKIPAGSIITSATLQLYVSRTKSETARSIEMHRLTASWGEGTSVGDGEGGGGTAATTGDATWIHRFYSTTLWTNPGGDFATTISATKPVGDIGYYAFGPAAQMKNDIQYWLGSPAGNFGWILIGNESTDSTAKRFESKESLTPQQRPQLFVEFNAPGSSVEWSEN